MAFSAEGAGIGICFLSTALCAVSAGKKGIQMVVTACKLQSVIPLLLAQRVDLAVLAEVKAGVETLHSTALRCKPTIAGDGHVSTADEGDRVVFMASAAWVDLPTGTERLRAIITVGRTTSGVVSTSATLNIPSTAKVRFRCISAVSTLLYYLPLEAEM